MLGLALSALALHSRRHQRAVDEEVTHRLACLDNSRAIPTLITSISWAAIPDHHHGRSVSCTQGPGPPSELPEESHQRRRLPTILPQRCLCRVEWLHWCGISQVRAIVSARCDEKGIDPLSGRYLPPLPITSRRMAYKASSNTTSLLGPHPEQRRRIAGQS